jgi:transposase
MLDLAGIGQVYLACGSTDLRKSIDGLAAIVQEGFTLNPFSPCLFAFCNRERDKIKILHWDRNGFWLYYKRLEKGRFRWPQDGSGAVGVTRRELRWLLDGLSLEQQYAHPTVMAGKVV